MKTRCCLKYLRLSLITRSLSLLILLLLIGLSPVPTALAASSTIWPGTAVPGTADAGPDSPVELGVKFRSDVVGTIVGIRFYKAPANTGVHVGNLWSSNGVLLASATFSNETASGWQQVNFTAPVSINSNTVYVASYHANSGHYSEDDNYFASSGIDNPPLHALANGLSGGDGVYAYSASSVFPALTWSAANYWVDVAFQAAGPLPLALTTTSLPGGALNVAYSATLSASGGTNPYTWLIADGSLPAGLTLNAGTGVISGTPTNTGTFSLTAGVRDASTPAQTASNALNITIISASAVSIWPSTAVPGLSDAGADSAVELGVKFRSDIAGSITGMRFYKAAANTGTHVANLWSSAGALLASATFSNETASGWQQVNFATPFAISANTIYVASYHANAGHYSFDVNYFQSKGADNVMLHALTNGVAGGNGVYAYGASSAFPNQTYSAANYWVDVVFRAGPAPTLTSIAVTPANPTNSVGGSQQFAATGTYSDSSTQNLTGQATWISSNSAVATITAGGLAAAVAPGTTAISAALAGVTGSTLLTIQTVPLRIVTASLPNGGLNVAYSASLTANGGTSPYSWSILGGSLPQGLTLNSSTGAISGTPTNAGTFSFAVQAADAGTPAQSATNALSITITPPSTTVTIWPSTAAPVLADSGPDSAVELGVKFRSDASGFVVGIRFYKAAANTGIHVGNLWSGAGVLLGSAAFTNESASGWQQVNFASPVAISANTVYVASYHANIGHYSDDYNYFLSKGVDNPPLHALANGVSGGDGVYSYGANSAFPTLTWNAGNYWVDVIVQPGVVPTLTSIAVTPASPTNSAGASQQFVATGIYSDGSSQDLTSQATWSSSNIAVATVSAGGVAAALVPGTAKITAALGPVSGSALLTVQPATFGIYGNGPGGPILVITGATNAFSIYLAEILLAEGLNEFSLGDTSSITSVTLAQYDAAILGQVALTVAQVNTLSNWVAGGGKLIAMRPDKQLAGLLGLVDAGTTLSEGYLLVNTNAVPGAGIVGQTIQFHGTADGYTLGSAASLATLYSNAQTATALPAVTLRSVGTNGGQAAAFTFDLARSIVYTRQGNPAWSGQSRDGLEPIRSHELYYGPASYDPQPNWVDFNKIAIPQADEQQRLLANLILSMDSSKNLLPRFWYFPNGYQAALVMTGDDHAGIYGGSYSSSRFDQYLSINPGGSLADWQVPRCTAYIFTSPSPSLTNDAQALAYQAAGFEICPHLDTGCADWTTASLTSFFATQFSQFAAKYPSLAPPTTHRIHCIAWSDYTTAAEVGLQFGVRLDVSYYYWPSNWIMDRPGMFTGSGMPMRFARTNGTAIDVYQAPSQMTDESGQNFPYNPDALLGKALGPEGYYGAFVANMHTDLAADPGAGAVLESALTRGVPVISARQLLTWLDARNGSAFQSVVWSNNTQSFSVQTAANARGLQTMVPVPTGYMVSALSYNSKPIACSLRGVKGLQYACFPALSGAYQVSFAPDNTPPTITTVFPAGGASNVSPATTVSVAFSEPIRATTLNPSTLVLEDSLGNAVAATVSYNPFTLTGTLTPLNSLSLSTGYTVAVKGGAGGVADAAGNPLAAGSNSTFTTAGVYTLWPSTAAPGFVDAGPDGAVELGVKFRSDVAGTIAGIRFYKAAANTGAHVGNLWTSAGVLLATATFTGETASGWQQVNFSTPVSIASNTVYVASYHVNGGHYSADGSFFSSQGVDNPPLHALASGLSGGNGVYHYGAGSAFPNLTYDAENYWVDVVLAPSAP
jgi:hypothetical protein